MVRRGKRIWNLWPAGFGGGIIRAISMRAGSRRVVAGHAKMGCDDPTGHRRREDQSRSPSANSADLVGG